MCVTVKRVHENKLANAPTNENVPEIDSRSTVHEKLKSAEKFTQYMRTGKYTNHTNTQPKQNKNKRLTDTHTYTHIQYIHTQYIHTQYIHTHIHTYTYTHIHTHTYTQSIFCLQ